MYQPRHSQTPDMTIAQNNPGNLEVGGPKFIGEVDPPDGIFLRFIDPVHGLRAIIMRLRAYQIEDNCYSIRSMIARWAPQADNNPTDAYIADVSKWTGIDPDANVDLSDPQVCGAMMKAITQQENGVQPFSQFTIDRAVSMVTGT
jgi:hypothetical protein